LKCWETPIDTVSHPRTLHPQQDWCGNQKSHKYTFSDDVDNVNVLHLGTNWKHNGNFSRKRCQVVLSVIVSNINVLKGDEFVT